MTCTYIAAGLDHTIVLTLVDQTILFRHYRPVLKKSGSRLPLVEVTTPHHAMQQLHHPKNSWRKWARPSTWPSAAHAQPRPIS